MPPGLDQIQQLWNLVTSLLQPLDQTTGQKAIRTITREAHRTPVNEGVSVNMTDEPMLVTTATSGAWDLHVVAVRFDEATARRLRISVVLGETEFHLLNESDFDEEYVTITDKIRLNAGDQVKVYAEGGTGMAYAEIRGELR